ncbi:DegT/DnrJ/EryC1/StrS family aminotransferase [Desulfonatronum thioautotrophicum]|uniref:DegT/DnrJ/EryC1/StrS family aminotransferase n=1 Tax=Desulfonatronum thioautotrophicum TaxID=617001 RepID=UPI0005EB2875|nr:DegT/DnrJ/EryC1/StrS family aminotransferase [Desulfonatronum thioautotrophicum]
MNITVTRPFLPPLEEYQAYVKGIWDRGWLTNGGPLANTLELRLKEYLGVDHLLFVANGTVALQIAIKALDLRGEIITTPFSYVASTSSIVWEGCSPVMTDIRPDTLNIDPEKIEAAITGNTVAILAVHVFGNPCDTERIQDIAQKHGLRVIYDAAHAFGTTYRGRSLLSFGDVSTCSFHATKLFHTIEGGAVVCPDPDLLRRMALMRNFGHVTAEAFGEVGINGKNSEMHAAMGLCNLDHIESVIQARAGICEQYRARLQGVPAAFQAISGDTRYNHAYFPVIFNSEPILLKVLEHLRLHSVFPRRYFYPSLTTLPYVQGQAAPIAEDIARRILCLPLYVGLSTEEVDMICRLIKRAIRY